MARLVGNCQVGVDGGLPAALYRRTEAQVERYTADPAKAAGIGAEAAMSTEDRIERARTLYEQAVFGGDIGGLIDAERELDAVEADIALARGRVVHARFLHERAATGSAPAEDATELPLFQRALDLYRALGDTQGEAESLFWIGCLHQVIRGDDAAAVPTLERARELAARIGDKPTESEALRHLGIAAHMAGRLDEARELLEESSALRHEIGSLPGVAANMVGLAYIAAAQHRLADARAILDKAHAIAETHGAHAIVQQLHQARTEIQTT
jgi:tetratricopeptide (TPR) repeat protein